jgi:hypothetical protein
MLRDASQGLRDLSFQVGYGVLCSAAPGDFANRKPGSFQSLQSIAVLLELNPMPGDFAVAVTTHRESPDSPWGYHHTVAEGRRADGNMPERDDVRAATESGFQPFAERRKPGRGQ